MSHLPYYTFPIHPNQITTPVPGTVAGCQPYNTTEEIEALKKRIAHLEYWIQRLVPDSK